ncbi:hybrid sensor histidine kinase/response regulator [Photobacterium swingsii]|uniref:Sensory/regulatory protein RpfC n=1 Tax=Photobacterium swingsii TaxID=680026 RepID=A0A2T3P4L0_9GAMM|nr:ATP-binding protein [Photobacterium swingsii]PSW23462.1 hybrid sensor histidine kinase/response regulator [Photobacterium swingsii]
MKLRTKTIIGIAVIEALALALLIVTGLQWLKSSNENRLKVGTNQLASVFAKATRDAVLATDLAYLDSFAESLVSEQNLAYIRITDRNGVELARHGDYTHVDTRVSPAEVTDGVYDVISPIQVDGQLYGNVEMGVTVNDLHVMLSQATRSSLLIAIAEMSLVALFSLALGTYLMRRLDVLRKGAEKVARMGPGAQIMVTGNDEVTRVSTAFNEMSRSLAKAQEKLAEKHQQQIALTNKVTELAQVAEHARDVIIITDAKGKITWVNPAFESLTGYTLSEVVGQSPGSLLQGDSSDLEIVHEMSRKIAQKEAVRVEILNYAKSGESYWVELDISPVTDSTGEIVRFIAVERDITQRRQVEEQLETALKEATRATRAKSEFLANMSHEIRTPMNAIMGFTELLLEKPMHAEHREQLELVHRSAGNLVAIINDILDYSKIEAGKLSLTNEAFDLQEVLESTIDLCGYQAKEKELPLVMNIAPAINTKVMGDKGRVNQILLNLIGNALKFTDSGTVTVNVEAESFLETTRFYISVEDTGIGIPAERLPYIMEKFEQVDNSATRQYEGTGLGLAICKRLIQLYGGELKVESEEGKGSCFSFSITLVNQHSKISVAANQDYPMLDEKLIPEVLRNKKILIAEDSYVNRLLIEKMLNDAPVELVFAEDGEQAVALYCQHVPDMVITDISMPNKDGYEATADIRTLQEQGYPWCPIIALSAHAMTEERERSFASGMNDHLSKPISKDLLIKMIFKWLSLSEENEKKQGAKFKY